MASVPDILGLTHIAITGVAQLVCALKNRVSNYISLSALLEEAEAKLKRIDLTSKTLFQLAEITHLDSAIFTRAFSDVQDVERELYAVQDVMDNSSVPATFFSSSRLSARLRDVNEKLSQVDHSFGLTVMVADVVSRKVERECADLRSRLNQISSLMNKVLSAQQIDTLSTETVLQTLESSSSTNSRSSGFLEGHQNMLAMESNAQLYYLLGRSYYKGDHEKGVNYFQSARFLHAALNGGVNSAAYYLGKLYSNGQGVHQCFRTAFKYFQSGARNGDAESMYEVGWCYMFGRGTAINREKSVKYTEMSAKGGSGAGLWNAGYHALHGNNSQRNWSKAVRLIQDAQKAGEIRANNELALCYEHGISVDRDPRKAFELLDEAHKLGDVMSIVYFARCYEYGIGTERNLEKAVALYKDIMSRGTWVSKLYQCYYGFLLVRGFGVTRNVHYGLRIIRKGLKSGFGCGWAVYGDCYRFGFGVERDIVKDVHCYSKAIGAPGGQRGIRDAHLALAEMYETGDGLAHDMAKAVHHYVRAANRMNPIAQWKAGSFYESGTQVDEDIHHAFYYFDLSARNRHAPAMRKAGELYMKGVGIQRDRTKAIHLLEEAVQRGDPKAKRILRKARRSNVLCWR